MPKKLTEAETKDKWNFYFPKLTKLQMQRKLLDMGKQGKQSALLRGLVTMFINGEIPEERISELIDQETYVTTNGKISVL